MPPPLDILVVILVVKVDAIISNDTCEMSPGEGQRLLRKDSLYMEATLVVSPKFSDRLLIPILAVTPQRYGISFWRVLTHLVKYTHWDPGGLSGPLFI
jgi:hypothetical protein